MFTKQVSWPLPSRKVHCCRRKRKGQEDHGCRNLSDSLRRKRVGGLEKPSSPAAQSRAELQHLIASTPSYCSPCAARTSQAYARDLGADGTLDRWHLIFIRSTMCFWKKIENRQIRGSNREVGFSYHCQCQV